MENLFQLLQVEHLLNPLALIDILLLWFAFYQVLLLIRRTRAVQMVYGLLAVVILWFVTSPGWFELRAVHFLLEYLFLYGGFAVIVIFQGPIRQALANFGRYFFSRVRQQDSSRDLIEEVALAASAMASRRVGALIVLERTQGLKNYIETGIQIDGVVTYDLLINIFSPKTPLHDGAVIVSEARLKAASCFLPLSTNPYISKEFGTRHRAAIGISEESDAVAVVVSEERGSVSVAKEGSFRQDLDTRELKRFLEENLRGERSEGASRSTRRRQAETQPEPERVS
jgi:diadenylate cyclase